ncbi:TSUP family transporter [Tardiphaga sp. 813_E8_N1_3]|uniref:sulfite exporter TauE/SafE family protein n=1 Tax=Tardiphaga sp. 813_E8_N1_3 TaxID=3240760 RepID=UPI003F26476E
MHDLMIAIGDLGAALTPKLVLLSIASIFVASVLRGYTGFGFALAAVPLLGLFMAPTEAVPVAIGLQLAGSLLDFRSASKTCDWPSLRWLIIGALVGSPLGTLILSEIPASISRLVISAITLLAVFALGRGFQLPAAPPRPVTSITGFFFGLFNGLAAMPGPPVVAYYMSLPMPRRAARASLMAFFLMTSITATVSFVSVGLMTVHTIGLSLLGLPVMWLGTRLGELAFRHGDDSRHRQVSIASLGVIALVSAIKGVSELT